MGGPRPVRVSILISKPQGWSLEGTLREGPKKHPTEMKRGDVLGRISKEA